MKSVSLKLMEFVFYKSKRNIKRLGGRGGSACRVARAAAVSAAECGVCGHGPQKKPGMREHARSLITPIINRYFPRFWEACLR